MSRSLCTSTSLVKSSDQDWTRLFRVYCGTARQWGDSAEPLVRRDKRGDMSQAVKIESNSQLQRIQRPQAITDSVLNQEFSRALKVALVDRRGDNQALARQIGPEAAPGNLERWLINLSSPGFYGELASVF